MRHLLAVVLLMVTIEIPAMSVPYPHPCEATSIALTPRSDGALRVVVVSFCYPERITCTTEWVQRDGVREKLEASCDLLTEEVSVHERPWPYP